MLEVLRGKKLGFIYISSSPLPNRKQTGQMSMKMKAVSIFEPSLTKSGYYLPEICSVHPLGQILPVSPVLVASKYYKTTLTFSMLRHESLKLSS